MDRIGKKEQLKGMGLTAGIVLLSLFVVFAIDGFFPLGSGSIVALDLNSQYTPLLYRFYDVVTGAKQIAVDFHIGGGINLYSDTVTELVNPFNYVLFLFGRANIYKAVNILLMLYVCAASLSSYYVLNRIYAKSNQYLKIALSVSFAMSYFVAYQYEIIRWMYIVVLFPFLFLSLKRLLEKEKPLAFTILLAYIFVLSLQFGIQLCMFSFVYSVCFLVNENREGKMINLSGHKCLLTGLSLIASILLSGFTTIPSVINIMNSARSSQNSSILSVITHHGLDNILERILEICNPVVLGLMAIAIFILKKDIVTAIKKYRVEAVCMMILVITVLLEPSNLLWHLGSYQCFPVRYGYTVVWLGIIVAVGLLDECTGRTVKQDKTAKVLHVLTAVVCSVAGAGILGFVYLKRLMFAQAFATLDISGVCKKETVLLYGIALVISIIGAVSYICVSRWGAAKLSSVMLVCSSALMGIVWFMAVLWPQSSEARIQNENNYQQVNSAYQSHVIDTYSGHTKENDGQSLNTALVTGAYSMSAYVPSGESKEYVNAMNKLGYDTPWISVASKGGSELSDILLGIDGSFYGAMTVSKEEYENIRIISDFSGLLADKEPLTVVFDNRKGTVTVQSEEEMNGYVLLPMAYMEGWKSEQGRIVSYLGGFIAVELTGSAETVILEYNIPGLKAGILAFIIGVLLTVVVINVFGKETVLDKVAKPVYVCVLMAFIAMVYILPNLGLVVFMGAKAVGKDISPYLEITKKDNIAVHTLLSQTMEEDGVHVLIGRNNLMNGKGVKISASDEESGYYRASKAADGSLDKESRWSSQNNWDNNDHFLQADFKDIKNIKAVKINWERTNASKYSIEVSEDGNVWKTVSDFNEPSSTNPQIIYYEDGIAGRYIRLHITDVIKNEEDGTLYYQNVSVYELEVYDDECDSFVINTPVLSKGTDREIPVPVVPEGYVLKIGGINYDNLRLAGEKFADNIAPVQINLGYELYCGEQEWDITGFDLLLPASEDNTEEAFDFGDITVREWKAEGGNLSFDGKDDLKSALINREDDSKLEVVLDNRDYLGDEGYEINISSNRIILVANGEKGIYWGRVTLSHMISQNDANWKCGIIRDYPEYAVRGFVLDVARRPVSMELLYRMLDELADNYMNTFQIHLSDNAIISVSDYDGTVQGARELFSAYRLESKVSNGEQKLTSDFYYTDEEFAKFISDAKAMGIDVVPEIDTPAHSLAITKLFPELSFNNNPELADTLDVSKPEVLELATNLWSEYLTGEEPLFEECNVLHLGTDEYFGDNTDYSKYVADICTSVKNMAKDKDMRIWASISYNNMDTSAIDKNVQMMVWSTLWSDPMETYNRGFGIINCINTNLYIVVGSGNDRLDMDNLTSKWEPNLFYDADTDEEIPAWSPRMLGACYSMWNEEYCKNGQGPDDDGIYDRFEEPVSVIANKLWNRK